MTDAINPDHYKRLPAEAIEIIESAIENAPSNQDAYLHGQVLKYILRCWEKNGIEDLRKAKWYLDRLIDSFDESEAEQLATVEVAGEVTGVVKPPDGWRWLEVGEVIRKGDQGFENGQKQTLGPMMIGQTYRKHWKPIIRRNRYEVGEKVVRITENDKVYDVLASNETGFAVLNGFASPVNVIELAPYIEDAK